MLKTNLNEMPEKNIYYGIIKPYYDDGKKCVYHYSQIAFYNFLFDEQINFSVLTFVVPKEINYSTGGNYTIKDLVYIFEDLNKALEWCSTPINFEELQFLKKINEIVLK